MVSPLRLRAHMLSCFSRVQLFVTLWTAACQDPLSMDSPGKNTGVGCCALLKASFLTLSPMKGSFPLKRFWFLDPPKPRAEQNSPLCNCGSETSCLSSPKGKRPSHVIGGVTVRYGSLDNVVFVPSSKIKGCPQIKFCGFLLVKSDHIALCILSLTPA